MPGITAASFTPEPATPSSRASWSFLWRPSSSKATYPHLRDRHIGEVVERQPFNEGPESPCQGVRFLPAFGGQVPGHPRKRCRPLDKGERISRFGTGTMPTGEGIQMPQPNCF